MQIPKSSYFNLSKQRLCFILLCWLVVLGGGGLALGGGGVGVRGGGGNGGWGVGVVGVGGGDGGGGWGELWLLVFLV